MKIQKNPSNRLFELDALRGLAALGVMIFHYTTAYTKFFPALLTPAFQFPFGQYGVGLFFMISGFVIFMTLENTSRPADFIVSRFSRLYPSYWAAVILTFTVVRMFSLSPAVPAISFKGALINLTMLQSWFKVADVDGVYWTLAVELSFYAFILMVLIFKKLKYIEEYGLIFLLIMVLNDRCPWHKPMSLSTFDDHSRLLTFGNLFFAGILFYNIKSKGNTWRRHIGLVFCLIVQYIIQDRIPQAPNTVWYGIIYFSIFYLFVYGRLSFLVQKPLIYLGAISYSLYLVHAYIGFVIINHLYAIHVNAWLCFIVPVICSFLMATAITYWIEKPAMNGIRHLYKNWKEKRSKNIYLFDASQIKIETLSK